MILFKAIHKNYVNSWKDYQKTSSFRTGARWNSAGIAAMYTSVNPQNAMLEIANYLASPKLVNAMYVLSVFEFPSLRLHNLVPNELPPGWHSVTKPIQAKLLGDKYLNDPNYDGIVVPSVTINQTVATHPVNDIRAAAYGNVVVNLETIGVNKITLVDSFSPIYSSSMFANP
ncbi:RES family NAD+ phosphorylase [Rheinheimera sp.]|uniref:RES family NAD+ phosphorylase n=1 Tax=Rheinheimera sp. TaxID=1869214 RepID=UPI00404840E9